MSEKLVREVYELRMKQYLYKETNIGELVSCHTRLVDEDYGAAIRSFRKQQSEKSRLPAVFWE